METELPVERKEDGGQSLLLAPGSERRVQGFVRL
jgi:hypothetical protein